MYDVIIIGAGPAGLAAGIYTSRRNLKTIILSEGLGGQAALTPHVENYPGFGEIHGLELMRKFEEQVKGFGVEVKYEGVKEIQKRDKTFVVKSVTGEYESKVVILAFGKSSRELKVPGENEFKGKGVSYCATCDAPLFRDKDVAVVGGGNSALDAALLASEISKKVYLIHRRDQFRGFESMVEKVKQKENVEFVLNSVVAEFKGDTMLKSIVVEDVNSKETREHTVSGVFVEIGFEVRTDFIKGLVDIDENNQIIVDKNTLTSCPGIFAAGDVTNSPFKQIVVAAGEGAKAGLQAYNHIHGIEPVYIADWGKRK